MADEDVLALSGLRRMVLHARDQLAAASPSVPSEFGYDKHWRPETIKRHAAMCLAQQVLTLVADCLPGGEQMTPDEATAFVKKHEKALAAAQTAQTQALRERDEAVAERKSAEEERDGAFDVQVEAEDRAESVEELLATIREIAETDVPEAMRLLRETADEEPDQDEAEPDRKGRSQP